MSTAAPTPTAESASDAPPSRLGRVLRLIGFLSSPDGERIRSLSSPDEQVAACRADATLGLTDVTPEDLALALSLCNKLRGLCHPRAAGLWTGAANLLASRARWQGRLAKGVAIAVPLIAVAILVPRIVQGRGYDAWVKAVAPGATQAASILSTDVLLEQDAGSISAFPAGAYVHAQAALLTLDAARAVLSHAWVVGNDPTALHAAFFAHPHAGSVEAHDAPLRKDAALKVRTARSELTIAHNILAYAQQWSNLAIPAALPPNLAGAWGTAASDMDTALHSGDATALQRAADRLTYLQTAGQQLAAVLAWTQDFDGDDLRAAQPLIEALTSAINADDRDTVTAELDRWRALRDTRQLGYALLVSGSPTDIHGVERKIAGSIGTPSDYLIVRAVDASGRAVTLPVYDTETRTLTHVQTFGVQVSPAIFAAAKAQIDRTHAALLLAQKAIGQPIPSFTVPVLAGRITHW